MSAGHWFDTGTLKDHKAARGAENRRNEARARVRDDFALAFVSHAIKAPVPEGTE